jgi:hypothetical protein
VPDAATWMMKTHGLRMKPIARLSGKRGSVASRHASRRVERVSGQRIARGGKMDADLMGAAGHELDSDQRRLASPFDDAHVALGRLAGGMDGVHASQPPMRNPADGNVDEELIVSYDTANQRPVHAPNLSFLPLCRQGGSRLRVPGEQGNSRRTPAQPVERGSAWIVGPREGEEGAEEVAPARESRETARLG